MSKRLITLLAQEGNKYTVSRNEHADYSLCSAGPDKSKKGVKRSLYEKLGCPAQSAAEWEVNTEEYLKRANMGLQCVKGRINRMAKFNVDTPAKLEARKKHIYPIKLAYAMTKDCIRKSAPSKEATAIFQKSVNELLETVGRKEPDILVHPEYGFLRSGCVNIESAIMDSTDMTNDDKKMTMDAKGYTDDKWDVIMNRRKLRGVSRKNINPLEHETYNRLMANYNALARVAPISASTKPAAAASAADGGAGSARPKGIAVAVASVADGGIGSARTKGPTRPAVATAADGGAGSARTKGPTRPAVASASDGGAGSAISAGAPAGAPATAVDGGAGSSKSSLHSEIPANIQPIVDDIRHTLISIMHDLHFKSGGHTKIELEKYLIAVLTKFVELYVDQWHDIEPHLGKLRSLAYVPEIMKPNKAKSAPLRLAMYQTLHMIIDVINEVVQTIKINIQRKTQSQTRKISIVVENVKAKAKAKAEAKMYSFIVPFLNRTKDEDLKVIELFIDYNLSDPESEEYNHILQSFNKETNDQQLTHINRVIEILINRVKQEYDDQPLQQQADALYMYLYEFFEKTGKNKHIILDYAEREAKKNLPSV